MNKLNFLIIIVFLAIFFSLGLNIDNDRRSSVAIDYKIAQKLIKQHYFDYIIDVRSNREWNEGRLPGAIHIPLNELYNGVKLYDMSSNILLYSGLRANTGSKILIQMGFKNVKYLKSDYRKLI